jgi:hypothetical protein
MQFKDIHIYGSLNYYSFSKKSISLDWCVGTFRGFVLHVWRSSLSGEEVMLDTQTAVIARSNVCFILTATGKWTKIVMNIERVEPVTTLTTSQWNHSCTGRHIEATLYRSLITCIRLATVITVRILHTSTLLCDLQHSGWYTDTVTSCFECFASSCI